MNAFELTTLLAEHARAGQAYLECLRVPSLSVGLYRLPAGGVDPQSPHTEDEVYYVVSGKAQIRVGDEDRSVGPDSIVLVAARVPHRFHSIEEDLTILVFFAPAEYSDEQGAPRLARPASSPLRGQGVSGAQAEGASSILGSILRLHFIPLTPCPSLRLGGALGGMLER